jgi:hypothetical protein
MTYTSNYTQPIDIQQPLLLREDYGTRQGVLNQIYEIIHKREEELPMIKIVIYDLIHDYSEYLTKLLYELYSLKVEILFWYKCYMVEYLNKLFERFDQHFGLKDTLLILNSNLIY